MGGAAVVADDPQHGVAVGGVAGEGAHEARHLGRGGVGRAGHDGADGGGDRPSALAVVAQARRHQQRAEIGVAQAQRAVLVGQFGDPARGVLRHHHRDLEHDGPQPGRMLQRPDVERTVGIAEAHQVERRQIARRVVEEHVLRARIRGVDASQFRAGVPVVDRGVVLHAGVGGVPGRFGDAVPQRLRAHRPGDLAGGALGELPLAVGLDRLQEAVGDAHRVVGVLARHGEIGFRLPIGVEGGEFDVAIALAGELDDPLDVVLGQFGLAGRDDLAAQLDVLLGVEGAVVLDAALEAGAHHGVEMAVGEPRAGDERGDLLLLEHLPGDEVLDVGMVDVDRHHLGRAPRRAARLDGARRAVADLEERHQARRLAAARQPLAFAAQRREVGAGAGAILEESRLAHPEIHDAALVHQIVGDALDEAGVRLRPFVGRRGGIGDAVAVIDEPMALAGTVDAVGPVQAGVEPLRRVGRADLRRQHVAMLVIEGASVFLAVEVAALPSPVGPGAGHAMENLAGVLLAAVARLVGQLGQCRLVGRRTPQPFRHIVLGDLDQARGHAGAAEILLREHVGCDLRPVGRHVDALQLKDDRTVGIADFGVGSTKRHSRERRFSCLRVPTLQTHRRSPVPSSRLFSLCGGCTRSIEHTHMGTN